GDPIAVIDLQPRPAVDAAQFAQACRRLGIELVLAQNGNATSVTRALAETAGLDVWRGAGEEFVRRAREHGRRVALLTDRGDDAEALALADLSVGLAAGLTEPFVPAVDVVVPDLATCAAVFESGAPRDAAAAHPRL